MEEFWELIDPTEAAPTSVANLKHDKKAYAHIWFLVEQPGFVSRFWVHNGIPTVWFYQEPDMCICFLVVF